MFVSRNARWMLKINLCRLCSLVKFNSSLFISTNCCNASESISCLSSALVTLSKILRRVCISIWLSLIISDRLPVISARFVSRVNPVSPKDLETKTRINKKTGIENVYVKGIFTEADAKNGNGRVYPESYLDREMNKLVERIEVGGLGGDGGIVAVDKNGNVAMEFNTASMYRATMNDRGKMVIKIYK